MAPDPTNTPDEPDTSDHQLAPPLAHIVADVCERLGCRLLAGVIADDPSIAGGSIEAAVAEAALRAFALGVGAGASAAADEPGLSRGRRCLTRGARRPL